jgi:hypothetical protein
VAAVKRRLPHQPWLVIDPMPLEQRSLERLARRGPADARLAGQRPGDVAGVAEAVAGRRPAPKLPDQPGRDRECLVATYCAVDTGRNERQSLGGVVEVVEAVGEGHCRSWSSGAAPGGVA